MSSLFQALPQDNMISPDVHTPFTPLEGMMTLEERMMSHQAVHMTSRQDSVTSQHESMTPPELPIDPESFRFTTMSPVNGRDSWSGPVFGKKGKRPKREEMFGEPMSGTEAWGGAVYPNQPITLDDSSQDTNDQPISNPSSQKSTGQSKLTVVN